MRRALKGLLYYTEYFFLANKKNEWIRFSPGTICLPWVVPGRFLSAKEKLVGSEASRVLVMRGEGGAPESY